MLILWTLKATAGNNKERTKYQSKGNATAEHVDQNMVKNICVFWLIVENKVVYKEFVYS